LWSGKGERLYNIQFGFWVWYSPSKKPTANINNNNTAVLDLLAVHVAVPPHLVQLLLEGLQLLRAAHRTGVCE